MIPCVFGAPRLVSKKKMYINKTKYLWYVDHTKLDIQRLTNEGKRIFLMQNKLNLVM